jgi:hypothetical protein
MKQPNVLFILADQPFCLFVSPHQPHFTPSTSAPERYYARLPEQLHLPENVPESRRAGSVQTCAGLDLARTCGSLASRHKHSPLSIQT